MYGYTAAGVCLQAKNEEEEERTLQQIEKKLKRLK